MGKSDYYKHGTYNEICAECGFKFKADELIKRWDGCLVCSADWEPRHPLDSKRVKPRRSTFKKIGGGGTDGN